MEDHIIYDNCEMQNNSGLLAPNDISYKINESVGKEQYKLEISSLNKIEIKNLLKEAQINGDKMDKIKDLQRQLSKIELNEKNTKETKFLQEKQHILNKLIIPSVSDSTYKTFSIIDEKLNFIIKHMKL